jgi:hypothetical protein
VSAIAHAHGGTVGVDSEPGSGATFWVRLPLARSEATPPVPLGPVATDAVPGPPPPPEGPLPPAPPPVGAPVAEAPPPVPSFGGDQT